MANLNKIRINVIKNMLNNELGDAVNSITFEDDSMLTFKINDMRLFLNIKTLEVYKHQEKFIEEINEFLSQYTKDDTTRIIESRLVKTVESYKEQYFSKIVKNRGSKWGSKK